MAQVGDPAVRTVAVVGEGPTLWMAAIALHRAFAPTGLQVTVVALPSTTSRYEVLAASPDLVAFHRLLGVAEQDLFRHADATFSMGQQYADWSGRGSAFLHAYGETGEPLHKLPFLQMWTKARLNGLRVGYEDFSLAAVAARNGRIDIGGGGKAGAYGYHFDKGRYEALLQAHAKALGISIVAGEAPRAEVLQGLIAAVHLNDGRKVPADLFVDATGGAALLSALDTTAPDAVEGPCDRMLIASAPPLSPLPLYGRIAAHEAGWVGLVPLAGRTAVTMSYGSRYLDDQQALERLQAAAGLRLQGDVAVLSTEQRLRRRLWVANCVAVGPAAFAGETMDSVHLLRDQIGIAHLVALLPVDRADMAEADIYNDEVTGHYRRLRDFQAAHHRLNRRTGEPFWDEARALPVSDELAYKIALFEERGIVAQYAGESFNADSWQSVLIGHGILPRSYDPQVDTVSEGEVALGMQKILGRLKTQVGAMPTHDAARARALRG